MIWTLANSTYYYLADGIYSGPDENYVIGDGKTQKYYRLEKQQENKTVPCLVPFVVTKNSKWSMGYIHMWI